MTETLVKPVPLSGWCLPAGVPHPTEHAKCERRLKLGLLDACGCPDHREVS